MRRSVMVALGAALVVVLVTSGLAVAWWTHDSDDRDPGMMTMSSQERGDRGAWNGPMMGGRSGGMHGGMMHGSAMHGGAMMQAVVRDEHGFLVEMIAHHEEAIDAAGELSRSDRAEMRELGRSIVEGQTAEVEQMRAWLERWYPDREDSADYEPMMRDLEGLSGDRLDQVFLEDMIMHHMMAVMMSRQLVVRDLAEHPAVDDLARSIATSQHAEMFTMRGWLQEWFG